MKTKNVVLEIDESVYKQLVRNSKRLRGTIGMRPDGTCDFHVHSEGIGTSQLPCARQKLPHGEVRITRESLRLNLKVSRTEQTPVSEMVIDTLQAKEFANEVIYGVSAWPYGV